LSVWKKKWISKSYSHCWKGKTEDFSRPGWFFWRKFSSLTNKGVMYNYHKTKKQAWII